MKHSREVKRPIPTNDLAADCLHSSPESTEVIPLTLKCNSTSSQETEPVLIEKQIHTSISFLHLC